MWVVEVNGYKIKPFSNLADADLTGADLTDAIGTGVIDHEPGSSNHWPPSY